MNVTLKKMSPKHVDQVAEIEKAIFPHPWSRRSFLDELMQNRLASYIVAVTGNKVVGYAGMWLILDEAHITNVAVHPGYRKKGIGKALMLELIRRAIIAGIVKMTLEVRPSNTAARHLYAMLGFEEKGLRRHYYTDTGEDAIIMWKDDLPGDGNRLFINWQRY